jgi:hypothetical protein
MPKETMVTEDRVQRSLDIARKVREQADRHDVMGMIYAAEWLLKNMATGVNGKIVLGEKLAKQVVSQYVQSLLNADQFEAAATVLWGEAVYDWRPHSAQETWRCLFEYDKLLIQGAGAMGKTFNAAAWFLLDWMRDPEYTCVKVVSLTEAHAQRNVFAAIKTFYRTALVRPEFEGSEDLVKSIQANDDDKNGIHLVAVPKGDSGMGTLRGFHPSPRSKAHPKWGRMSRTHVVLDEAEEVPAGVWEGLQNILSAADTEGAKGRIKIFGASNPKDRTSEFGKRCEPTRGWQSVDCEEDFEWESRDGWHILRLDAARCENVVKRKIVFHGFQTFQGYQAYEARGKTAEYYCADTETEVLSKRGWLKHNQLNVGDTIYTVNIDTGLAEWQKVKEVFAKHYDGNLVSIESRHISALVTSNHRWATTNKQILQTKKSFRLKIKETSNLAKHDMIPLCRKSIDNEKQYDEDFAELIGWIVTDGSFSEYNRVFIYQSQKANPHKCDKIRDLLIKLRHPFQESEYNGIIHFKFANKLGKMVKDVIPNKKLTIYFIEKLNNDGRRRLFESMVLGDGGVQGGSTKYICTKDKEQAEVYAILINRLGMASRIHERFVKGNFIKQTNYQSRGCTMYYVDALETKNVRVQYMNMKEVPYSGVVWCPRTDNQTFFARRDGKCYFTGNTMARGWFPQEGIAMGIITPAMMDNAMGTVRFIGPVVPLAAFDLALEGKDQVVCSHGRFGLSDGWTPRSGSFIPWRSPRVVLQLDSQIDFPKKATLEQTKQIMDFCKQMKIAPNWLCVDRTGNGAGISDALCSLFGSEVLGVNYSWAASETHILGEDSQKANELYSGVVTELIFGLAKYLEFEYLKISPSFSNEDLVRQAIARRYKQAGQGLVRVESKGDFVKRTRQNSPDQLDSLSLLVYLLRQREGLVATMTEPKKEKSFEKPMQSIESMGYVDFTE